MFKYNVDYHPFKKMNTWRKIAMGTWGFPGDPSIYARTEIDCTEILRATARAKSEGVMMSPLTLTVSAIAKAIAANPNMNGVIRFGRMYYRKSVNICVPVIADKTGEELTGLVIKDCHLKTVTEIAKEIDSKGRKIRAGEDTDFEGTKKTLGMLPGWMMFPLFRLIGFILYPLNLWHSSLGMVQDAFGSAQVTSTGNLGLGDGYGPLDPYSRCPIVAILGTVIKKPVVVNDQIVIRPILSIGFTFDHRVIDGALAGKFGGVLRKILESPYAGGYAEADETVIPQIAPRRELRMSQ